MGIGLGLSVVILVVFVVLNMMHQSLGQSVGCTTALVSLSPCLNYISGSSSSSNTPSSSCCSRLANVVQSQPQCLCSALNGDAAASLGVTINHTRALALPAACHLQTPPPSRCNDVSGGSMAPTTSPVSSPESSPIEEGFETPTTTTWEANNNFGSATGSNTNNVPIIGAGNPSTGQSLIKTSFYLINVAVLLISQLC